MKRIIIIDDHQLVADGFYLILSQQYDVKIAHTLAQLQSLLLDGKWDMALLDICMQGKTPDIRFLELLKRWSVPVLAITGIASDALILQYLQGGATGIFRKQEDTLLFTRAVEAVLNGQQWISAELMPQALDMSTLHKKITDRELDILGHFANMPPPTNEEIALLEHISTYTVRTHVSHLIRALKAKNRYALREKAIEQCVPLRAERAHELRQHAMAAPAKTDH